MVRRRDADCGDGPALRDLMRARLFWAAAGVALVLTVARFLYQLRRL